MADPTRSSLDSLRRIVQALRASAGVAEKKFGLSGAQLFVLQSLGDGRGVSLNELARRTRTHQSSVSVVVSRLVEKGLVSRSPAADDARRLVLTLRPEGRRFVRGGPGLPQQRLVASIDALSAADRRRLAALLARVAAGAGLDSGKPEMFFAAAPKRGKRA